MVVASDSGLCSRSSPVTHHKVILNKHFASSFLYTGALSKLIMPTYKDLICESQPSLHRSQRPLSAPCAPRSGKIRTFSSSVQRVPRRCDSLMSKERMLFFIFAFSFLLPWMSRAECVYLQNLPLSSLCFCNMRIKSNELLERCFLSVMLLAGYFFELLIYSQHKNMKSC